MPIVSLKDKNLTQAPVEQTEKVLVAAVSTCGVVATQMHVRDDDNLIGKVIKYPDLLATERVAHRESPSGEK